MKNFRPMNDKQNLITGPTTSRADTVKLTAASGYTDEEKRVLNHTSNINDHIFVPFMDVDVRDKFVFTIPFTDKVNLFSKTNCESDSINVSSFFYCGICRKVC